MPNCLHVVVNSSFPSNRDIILQIQTCLGLALSIHEGVLRTRFVPKAESVSTIARRAGVLDELVRHRSPILVWGEVIALTNDTQRRLGIDAYAFRSAQRLISTYKPGEFAER